MARLRIFILSLLTLSCLTLRAEQFTDSLRVYFKMGDSAINCLFDGNNAALHNFSRQLSRLADSTDLSVNIERILITGAASPDGPYAINERMSHERAAAICDWLHNHLEFPDSLAHFVFKGRDWQGLLRLVERDNAVPYRRQVMDIICDIVKCPPPVSYENAALARLKALHGGVPYRYMLHKHFPELRASEVFITATVEQAESQIIASEPVAAITTTIDSLVQLVQSAPLDSSTQSDSRVPESPGYIFALKTNMLYDVALTPNIGAEFPIGKHFSVGANWMYAWWKNHDRNRHWRIYGGDINARYYFGGHNGRPLTGHHVGIYGQVLVFQIAFGGKGYITGNPGENLWGKPYMGGGIEYGYSKQISRRLNIDFTLGLGYMAGEYREYRPVDDHYVWQSSHRRNWIGPTKAEISLVWLIGKMQKGGAK